MCILKLTKLRSHSHITEGLISVHWAPAVSCSSTVLSKTEALILWPPDARNWLIGKDPDAGKDWRQEEKWMTEDEIAGLHHWHDERKFEQAPGVCDGQGSLACCSPWGCKELDMTKRLNWTELKDQCLFRMYFVWLKEGKLSKLCIFKACIYKELWPWHIKYLSTIGWRSDTFPPSLLSHITVLFLLVFSFLFLQHLYFLLFNKMQSIHLKHNSMLT